MDSQKSHSTSGNANSNIKTAERHDENGLQYDDFAYQYHTAGRQLLQNRLYDLYDGATHTTGADIVAPAGTFDNSSTGVNQNNNYSYDELGNLIADKREEIGNIHWTVAGKVKRITRTPGSTKPKLVFGYGADGQRILKQVGDPDNEGYREHYIRDAQGNIMAIYKYTNSGTASTKVTERPVYGSSRLGSYTRQLELMGTMPPQYYPYTQPMQAPLKRYELTDHLGNVSTVVTGRLLPLLGPGVQFQAEVVSAQGYEAFGSLLPGRNYSSDNYRFGFNGQEKDDEVYGSTGASYDFGARMYDPRVGRWLSLDPFAFKFPSESPYLFAGANPIYYIDKNGEYKLPTKLQEQYPKLTNLVKNLETIMKSNHGVWEAFKSNLGLTEEQAVSIVRWDSGPELSVEPMVNKPGKVEFGETTPGPDGAAFVALSKIMVQTMEGQHESEAVTPEGAAALTFITLAHEGQHAGELLVNDGKFLPKRKGEQGFKFEKSAFGKEYGTDNYREFGTDHPGLNQRVIDGSIQQVDRMETRPTTIDVDPLPDRKPVGR